MENPVQFAAAIVIYLGLGIILAHVINGISVFFHYKRSKILTWDLWWAETLEDTLSFYTWWYLVFWPFVWLFIGFAYLTQSWFHDQD